MARAPVQPGRLPWPEEWPRRTPLRWIGLAVFFALAGAGGVSFAIASLANGDYADGIFVLAVSLILLTIAAVGYLVRQPGRRRDVDSIHSAHIDEFVGQAVAIPYSRVLDTAVRLFFLTVFLFSGLLALVTALVISASGWGDTGAILWFAFSSLMLLMVLGIFLQMARGKIARGKLALTPHGIHHRSWTFMSSHSWEDIVSISARSADVPLIAGAVLDTTKPYYRRTSRLWKQPELALAPHMGVKGNYLSVDPALAYHALRYYHEHPEARAELGTSVGVDRLRRADVVGQECDHGDVP